ncbi:IspD/TarI family cytidylyltransferase [Nocardioides aequoreus]|uniref:IspD/TarI family cytidylyltransferase n=1 Tax=Nocardioides aequoreus TaxID=397278 RepID=UPI0006909F7D|nr:IspD/TarI family cytidylyltransferase [Nocardioides aequoreus]
MPTTDVPPRTAAVVLAAGSGTRVGAGRNKVLLPLDGQPVMVHAVRTVLQVEGVHRIVLVVRPDEREQVRDAVAPHLGPHDLWVVDGGSERHDSEWRALQVLADEIDGGELEVVAVHDAARPLARPELWRTVVDAAAAHGGALPARPTSGVLRTDGTPVPGLAAVQTPQAFRAAPLLAAYRAADAEGFRGSDTAACLERYGPPDLRLVGVPTGPDNLKVTFAEDLALAEALLRRR